MWNRLWHIPNVKLCCFDRIIDFKISVMNNYKIPHSKDLEHWKLSKYQSLASYVKSEGCLKKSSNFHTVCDPMASSITSFIMGSCSASILSISSLMMASVVFWSMIDFHLKVLKSCHYQTIVILKKRTVYIWDT